MKFWRRYILKPKLHVLVYKALGIWFLTYFFTLTSQHIPSSSGLLALSLGSNVQSRMPSCALPLPQSLMSISSSSSLFTCYHLGEAILTSCLKDPASINLGPIFFFKNVYVI